MLLVHVNMAMMTSAVLGMYALIAAETGDEELELCDSDPVPVQKWFRTYYMLQFFSVVLFGMIHCGLSSLMTRLLKGARAAVVQPELPSAVVEEPVEAEGDAVPAAAALPQPSPAPAPVPSPSPAPGPTPAPEPHPEFNSTEACLLYNVFSSTVMLFVITGLLLLWCFLGVYSAVDAGKRPACKTGMFCIWFLSIVGFVQVCCCHIFTTSDVHAPDVEETRCLQAERSV